MHNYNGSTPNPEFDHEPTLAETFGVADQTVVVSRTTPTTRHGFDRDQNGMSVYTECVKRPTWGQIGVKYHR